MYTRLFIVTLTIPKQYEHLVCSTTTFVGWTVAHSQGAELRALQVFPAIRLISLSCCGEAPGTRGCRGHFGILSPQTVTAVHFHARLDFAFASSVWVEASRPASVRSCCEAVCDWTYFFSFCWAHTVSQRVVAPLAWVPKSGWQWHKIGPQLIGKGRVTWVRHRLLLHEAPEILCQFVVHHDTVS